jgi:hypothetical protein
MSVPSHWFDCQELVSHRLSAEAQASMVKVSTQEGWPTEAGD